QKATVRWVTALYRFFTDKNLDQHKSHLAIHSPDLDRALKSPASEFVRCLVALVPGLGVLAAAAIEKVVMNPETKQGSLRKLMFLSEQDLAAVEVVNSKGGRKRLGPARAKKVME